MDFGTETPQLVVRPFGEGPGERSSSAEQEYGNSNTSSNGGLSGEVQPAAISEGEDSKNRGLRCRIEATEIKHGTNERTNGMNVA
ncbi:unnamed protein product, partial [Ectocarpus sp. 12 AP-2014]